MGILRFIIVTVTVAGSMLLLALVTGAFDDAASTVGMLVLAGVVGVAAAGAHAAHTRVLTSPDGRASRPWLALPAGVALLVLAVLLVGESGEDVSTFVALASAVFGAAFASICAMVGVREYRYRQRLQRSRAPRRTGTRPVGRLHVAVLDTLGAGRNLVCASRIGPYGWQNGDIIMQVGREIPMPPMTDAALAEEQRVLAGLLGPQVREAWSEPYAVCVVVDDPAGAGRAGGEHWAAANEPALTAVLEQLDRVHAARGVRHP